MKSTTVAVLLIVSFAAVFAAPAKTNTRLEQTEEAAASNTGLIQTLIGYLQGNSGPRQPSQPSVNILPIFLPEFTAQPGAFQRPMPANANQQGGFVAGAQPIAAVRPVKPTFEIKLPAQQN